MPEDIMNPPDGRKGRHDLDPTPRTVQQIYREIASLKELTFAKIDALEGKLDGLEDRVGQVPGDRAGATAALAAVMDERLHVHEERFRALEAMSVTRLGALEAAIKARKDAVEAAFQSSKDAVAAALAAQKEAVADQNRAAATAIAKSEMATTKQIDSQAAQNAASQAALSDRIDDIKDRVTKLESRADGAFEERSELRAVRSGERGSHGLWVAVAGLGISLMIAIVGWLLSINRTP